MAETDWTEMNDGLDIATVDRGVTTGIARPPGGGSFLFGFNSLSTAAGAVGFFTNQVNFAPMAKVAPFVASSPAASPGSDGVLAVGRRSIPAGPASRPMR